MASLQPAVFIITLASRLRIEAIPVSLSTPNPETHDTPVCTPWCKGGHCPVNVTRLEDGVCHCGSVMTASSGWAEFKLRLKKTTNNTLEFKWMLKHQPSNGSSTLYLPTNDDKGVCFSIALQMSSCAELLSTADAWMKITCTQADKINIADPMLKLIDLNTYTNIANLTNVEKKKKKKHKKHMKTKTNMKRNNKGRRSTRRRSLKKKNIAECDCWTPDSVSIRQIDNNTLEAVWEPFGAWKDLRVRIVPEEDESIMNYNDETITITSICKQHIKSKRISNFKPGVYKAMVGAAGCDCIQYKESEPFTLSPSIKVAETTSTTSKTTKLLTLASATSSGSIQQTAVIVVGVLAFITCTSVGLLCLIQRGAFLRFHRRKYDAVSPSQTNDADGPPNITIIEGSHDVASSDIASWIKSQLEHSNTGVSLSKTDQLGTSPGLNDLLIMVSLQDIQTFQGPLIDHSLSNKTISVLMDYARDVKSEKCPLVVHVPSGLTHKGFNTKNNERKQVQVLDLVDALRRLNPKCDPRSDDVVQFMEKTRDFAENRRNEIRNIFLISGGDHSLHNDACLELTKLLRSLGKTVVYMFEGTNRKEMQQGLNSWTMSQISSADLVLVVGSEVLYKIVQCYENERDLPNNIQNQAICAPMALKMISDPTMKSKIAYVSFGYGSKYIDNIIKIYPHLDTDMKYDLVETKECVIDENDDNESRALRLFFSRLSADQNLVKNAAEDASFFFKKVEEMAAMMVNDSDWLKAKYGSVESLTSLMTISQKSVIFRHSWVRLDQMSSCRIHEDRMC